MLLRVSRRRALRCATILGLLIASTATKRAAAGDFDQAGVYSADKKAVFVESFETAPPQAEGQPPATILEDKSALLGKSVLQIEAFGQSAAYVGFPAGQGSYRARAWIKGDGLVSLSIEYLTARRSRSRSCFQRDGSPATTGSRSRASLFRSTPHAGPRLASARFRRTVS